MSNATTRTGSLNGRIGLVALLASVCLVVAAFFGASNAKAATIGDPVDVDFNHVGVNITAALLGPVNEMVLKPSSGLGNIEMRGTYTAANGDFTVPKEGGLTFPNIALDLGGIDVTADIALVEDATGNYDAATGAMSLNPKISLTLGISDLSVLPLGLTGALGCKLSPIDVSLSTDNGWPADASRFTGSSPIKGGSLTGAWTVKPGIVATVGEQGTCDLVGGLLEPVGGLWLAQSDSEISTLPANSTPKPDPAECPDGFTGTPPDCEEIPPPPAAKVAVSKPKAVAIKRGKSGTVRVTVRNTGGQTASGVRVCGTIPSKIARAPKCVSVGTIAAGSSKAASLRLTVSKRARGKGTLKINVSSSNAGKASTSVTVTVRR